MMSRKKKEMPMYTAASDYSKNIIKCLEWISALSGFRPYQVFDDWLRMTEATLERLPAHLESAARTGQLAQDTPEAAEFFSQVHSRYKDRFDEAWELFGDAFGILLESTALGLNNSMWESTIMGPDVIGNAYMQYANTDPSWQAQYFTPWNVAVCMARIQTPDGEALVHERLNQACQHPDNPLAFATLITSLAIKDPAEARQWFINRLIPAAWPTLDPITISDPCCGSGIMFLAAASCFPDWATQTGIVQVYGADIDEQCVRLSKVNCMLYGLNGFGFKLAAALSKGLSEKENTTQNILSPLQAWQVVSSPKKSASHNGGCSQHQQSADSPTFEELFQPMNEGDKK
jgi:hypothetical protein